ncbi:hypothetical protein SRHO_G00027900 [Serrasalmus rhombeus]
MGIINSCVIGVKHPSTEVTDAQQAKDSSALESSPKIVENGINKALKIQNESVKTDTQRKITVPSAVTFDHISDVDKKNFVVICAGKSKIFFIFPLERISVLLEEACDWAGKEAQNMKLVFEGVELDVMKTVSEYPRLRRGSKVNLIRVS